MREVKQKVKQSARDSMWARLDSNQRPIGYEPSALPLSYGPPRTTTDFSLLCNAIVPNDSSKGQVFPHLIQFRFTSSESPYCPQ